jgi:hypothetical protein
MGSNPFEDLPDNVNMITYTEEKGFSTKLTERRRAYNPSEDKRRGWKTQGQKTWKQSFREMAKVFMPKGATADVSVDVENNSNIFYTSPLYMGSEFDEVIVIPDTGSLWLIVEGSTCDNCLANTWDFESSSTYESNAGITD